MSESGGCCLTQSGDFYNVERGNPLPYKLPIEKQREIGMLRETWTLEIIADPASNAKITRPLTNGRRQHDHLRPVDGGCEDEGGGFSEGHHLQ